MRNILNISLPASMSRLVDEGVKKGHYATKSEFIRSLLRSWAEGKLSTELEEGRNEIREGNGRLLKSLKNLL
jgi:Arc/MetJ-type ribon-helix-helix transcriptional regulator